MLDNFSNNFIIIKNIFVQYIIYASLTTITTAWSATLSKLGIASISWGTSEEKIDNTLEKLFQNAMQ